MKPIPFLARFKVSAKIGVGFAIVLLLLTAVSSFGGMALNDGVRLQTSYASISDNAQRVVRIAHLVAEMRRDVRVAIDENDFEAAAVRASDLGTQLSIMLEEALKATSDPERRENLTRMQSLLRAYEADFSKALTAEEERTKVDRTGHEPDRRQGPDQPDGDHTLRHVRGGLPGRRPCGDRPGSPDAGARLGAPFHRDQTTRRRSRNSPAG